MKKQLQLLTALAVLCFSQTTNLQAGTFTTVYNILQANCSGSGCHGGASPVAFSVDGSEADVYDALVGATCENQAASTKGHKLVDPGHPYNSFLLKKIGASFDTYLALDAGEGDEMFGEPNALEDYEIELIRQWILMGARETQNDVNYQVLKDYYNNGGFDFIPVPAAPDPSEGMQVRFGPIFLAGGEEVEWDKKENLRNQNTIKVYRTDGYMSWQSHHMLLFKFDNANDAAGTRDGMRLVPSEAFPFNGNVSLTGAWQNDDEFELPEKTAFFWEPNTVLDFDYHIKNYSNTEILPSDFYLNIYWDNSSDRDIQMFASLENNAALLFTQGNQTRTVNANFNQDRYIYMLSTHTHQWGTDYDVYLKNQDGSRGDKIYEGFYNVDYTYNQGFYDWEHPPVRYFKPLKKASYGLIHEAKWNVGVPFVTFGLTADDEMMLFTYLYTTEEVPMTPTGIEDLSVNFNINAYPNPTTDRSVISYNLSESANVAIEVTNLLGQQIKMIENASQPSGRYVEAINLEAESPGVYLVTIKLNGEKAGSAKIIRK